MSYSPRECTDALTMLGGGMAQATPHDEINLLLRDFAAGADRIFGAGLVGIYLSGSLSYGDFEAGRSDIDLAVILKQPASPDEIATLRTLHEALAHTHPKWGERVECSYVPVCMLANVQPPAEPRPWIG